MELRIKMRLMPSSETDPRDDANNSPYLGLIYNVFQLGRDAQGGIAIAVTAANRGAGTTYIVSSLAAELGGYPSNRIVQIDLAALASIPHSAEDVLQMALPTSHPGIFQIRSRVDAVGADTSSAYWHASAEHRKDCIDRLRERFHYVVFDCPPVVVTSDALGIASLVDGVLLVIEANRTTRKEIRQAERQIEVAGGRICGSILNKRKSPVPTWVERRL